MDPTILALPGRLPFASEICNAQFEPIARK